MARAVISLVVLGLALTAALSPTVVRLERSSRELAATFIYEGLLQRRPPTELFDEPTHRAFWFDQSARAVGEDLEEASVDKTYELEVPMPPASEPESASPLLAARGLP